MLTPHIYFLKYIINPKEIKRIIKKKPIKINGLNIKKTLL
jgi:ribosomal protein S4E